MWLVEAAPNRDSIKKLTARFRLLFPGLSQSLAIFTTYLGWSAVFKFLSVTFVAYFVLSSGGGNESSRFDDVNEALSASQLALVAICAGIYLLFLRLFEPPTKTLTFHRFQNRFVPGFMHGAVLAAGVALAFLLGGIYRYLGFFIQPERAPLAMAGLLIRISATLAFVYFEELIFRQSILRSLTRRSEFEEVSATAEFWRNISAAAFTSVMFVTLKIYQFDLGWMQAITLYLISIALCLRALSTGDFVLSAGFWSAILIVFQAILSLPLMGNEFSGLLLIKYQPVAPDVAQGFMAPENTYGETLRFITGGAGGPLAGLAFQGLIFLDIIRGSIRYRRRLSSTNS